MRQTGITPNRMLADKGYATEDQIQNFEKEGIGCIVPFPEKQPDEKQMQAGIDFTYDNKIVFIVH